MSPAASTSGSRSAGWKPTNRTLSRLLARASSSLRAEPPPLITNTTSVRSERARAAASTKSSDWENPTFPAYMTTRRPPSPCSARYRPASGSAGTNPPVVTKFWVTRPPPSRSSTPARSLATPVLRPSAAIVCMCRSPFRSSCTISSGIAKPGSSSPRSSRSSGGM